MSIRRVPLLVCDGCGTVINMNYYLTRKPPPQAKIVQQPSDCVHSPERHFCCAACEGWWDAQFPASGPWGPSWDERDWWCETVGECAESTRIRTARGEFPLIDFAVHNGDPEPVP